MNPHVFITQSLPDLIQFQLQMAAIATILAFIAVAMVFLARKESAAYKHRVCSAAMAAILLTPMLSIALPSLGPSWRLGSFFDDDKVGEIERRSVTGEIRPYSGRQTSPSSQFIRGISGEHGVGREEYSSGVPNAEGLVEYRHNLQLRTASANPSVGTFFWSSVVCVWPVGIALASAFLVRNVLLAFAIKRRAVPVSDFNTLTLLQQAQKRASVRIPVSLLCSPEIQVPVTAGCFRPVIILPAGFGQWTAERCRIVFAHEMAHIQRRDVLWQLIARFTCCVYWYHPLVWLVNRRINIEQERACDDAVLGMGEQPGLYAKHLLDVASVAGGHAGVLPNAIAMATPRDLEKRIRTILLPHMKRAPVSWRTGRLLTTGMVFVAMAVAILCPSINHRAAAGLPRGVTTDTRPEKPIESDASTIEKIATASAMQRDAGVEDDQQLSVPADDPLLTPVVGKGFILVPISTDLQRAYEGSHEKGALFLLVNGNAAINDDNTLLDTSQVDFVGIEEALVAYLKAGMDMSGQPVVVRIVGVPERGEEGERTGMCASTILSLYFSNQHSGDQVSAIVGRHKDPEDPLYWDRLVAELVEVPSQTDIRKEDGIGDDLVRVYPIRTPLSRYLFGGHGEDAVVHNIKPFAKFTAEEIEEFPKMAKGYLDKLGVGEAPGTRMRNYGRPASKGNLVFSELREGIRLNGLDTKGSTLWISRERMVTPYLIINLLGMKEEPIENPTFTVVYPPEVRWATPVKFEPDEKGLWHSQGLVGDEEFELTIKAPGYKAYKQTLMLPYNTTKEIIVELSEK